MFPVSMCSYCQCPRMSQKLKGNQEETKSISIVERINYNSGSQITTGATDRCVTTALSLKNGVGVNWTQNNAFFVISFLLKDNKKKVYRLDCFGEKEGITQIVTEGRIVTGVNFEFAFVVSWKFDTLFFLFFFYSLCFMCAQFTENIGISSKYPNISSEMQLSNLFYLFIFFLNKLCNIRHQNNI